MDRPPRHMHNTRMSKPRDGDRVVRLPRVIECRTIGLQLATIQTLVDDHPALA